VYIGIENIGGVIEVDEAFSENPLKKLIRKALLL
jgi:hypothetical protein